ncbi:MAG: galactokinase family protein [Chloroflexota bacterium]
MKMGTDIPIQPAQSETDRIAALKQHLTTKFSVAPEYIKVVRAPLRISPIGAHIDHQLGHVTGLTIDRTLLLAFAPTDDQSIQIESLNFSPGLSFQLDQVPDYIPHDWGNYIRGAVLALQQQHALQHGVVGCISGEMPGPLA